VLKLFMTDNIFDKIKAFTNEYRVQLNNSFNELYKNITFLHILEQLEKCWTAENTVFLAGNGGSSSIVSHFATDWSKGLSILNNRPNRSLDLSSNLSLLTAAANDLSWEEAITFLFSKFAKKNDLLFLVSSSGESKNIVNLASFANQQGNTVIGLSGNGNSSLTKYCNYFLTCSTSDTQIIEDTHAIFGHLVLRILGDKHKFYN